MTEKVLYRIESECNFKNMKTAKMFRKPSAETIPLPEVSETDPAPVCKKAFQSKTNKKFAEAIRSVQQQLSVKERYDLFMGETSFTAMTKIYNAKSIVKKITWILVVVAMLSWLSVQCFWLFEKFFSYPVEVKIESKSAPKLDYPSITFCNRNPLKRSTLVYPGNPFRVLDSQLDLQTDKTLYSKAVDMFKADHGDSSSEENAATTGMYVYSVNKKLCWQ